MGLGKATAPVQPGSGSRGAEEPGLRPGSAGRERDPPAAAGRAAPLPAGRCPRRRPRGRAGAPRALCKSRIGAVTNGRLAGRGGSQWGAAGGGRAGISAARRRRRWQCGGGRRAGRSGGGCGRREGPSVRGAYLGGGGEGPLPAGHVGPGEVRRQGAGQGQVALVAGRVAVPRRPGAPVAAEGELRGAGGRRGAGVPGGGAGVPLGRDPGAGGQRGPRQQEDADHPPAPAAGHPQRRGAQQAAGRRDHRPGRRPAQHPGRAAAQEDAELEEVSAAPGPPPGPLLAAALPPLCQRGRGSPPPAPPSPGWAVSPGSAPPALR